MIQEDQQEIIISTDENRSILSNESKQIEIYEKQKGKIRKHKNKRKLKLIWVPLIMKNILKADTEPIYIYNLFKMLKSYDDDEIEKYQNYGIQDAGIGHLNSIGYDKIYQCIDISLSIYSNGQIDMNYLIQLYKSYQNQKYYELALTLQEYQQCLLQDMQQTIEQICVQRFNQVQIDEDFIKFEKIVKQWLHATLENEIYEVHIGNLDIEKKFPVIKKLIYSKNLLLFIGEELNDTYQEISSRKNIDFLTNFLKTKHKNGQDEMDDIIRTIKTLLSSMSNFEINDEIQTLDGYTIPTKKIVQIVFYDFATKQTSKNLTPHFFIVTKYSFEPMWIKYLIDQRSSKKQNNGDLILKENVLENFEEICQKEYFYEKFNYQPTNKL